MVDGLTSSKCFVDGGVSSNDGASLVDFTLKAKLAELSALASLESQTGAI